jgi:hypothetical protein
MEPKSSQRAVSAAEVAVEANAFLIGLRAESDRGAALVGVAYLDELVEQLVRASTIDDKVLSRLRENARVDLAYALGWIGPEMYSDLGTARKIRNLFAHSHKSLHFDDNEIGQLCGAFKGLKYSGPYRLRCQRDQFMLAILFLTLQLTQLCRHAHKPVQVADPPVQRYSKLPDGLFVF